MEYRQLGKSGLQVSAIGLGGNTFGRYADEAKTIAIVQQALDLGVNFIDTANTYNRGASEEFVGKGVKGRRDQAIIGTKAAGVWGQGPNQSGASRQHLTESIHAGLRRLDTDYIDLFQVHFPDPKTPIEETLRALDDLVRQGKIRYIGCSNYASWQLCEALWTSREHHLAPYVSVQPPYNLLNRGIERELVPFCEAYGIGIIPYSPLAGGFLTGKYRPGEAPPEGTRGYNNAYFARTLTERNYEILAKLEEYAAQRDHAVGELAFAWLLARPMVSTVIAGATSPEQVAANAQAGEWRLTEAELAELDQITQR
ncbi:MAG: aldo/keto reductase [Chloroflexi bacterium]|nr:aldo/keto reductase [Chloroflexota bacterium]